MTPGQTQRALGQVHRGTGTLEELDQRQKRILSLRRTEHIGIDNSRSVANLGVASRSRCWVLASNGWAPTVETVKGFEGPILSSEACRRVLQIEVFADQAHPGTQDVYDWW